MPVTLPSTHRKQSLVGPGKYYQIILEFHDKPNRQTMNTEAHKLLNEGAREMVSG